MGDAGLPTPLQQEQTSPMVTSPAQQHGYVRDIHILVTGFGPFKSFSNNPSWLIASALSIELDGLSPSQPQPLPKPQQHSPSAQHVSHPLAALLHRSSPHQNQNQNQNQPEDRSSEPAHPLRSANTKPYRIHIHTYPSAVRVAYDSTSVLIPSLLNPRTNRPAFPSEPSGIEFDYVLHIGLASGRDSYTLETIAHRDDYLIPDIDDDTGYLCGEKVWKALNIPAALHVGWHSADVLRRWTDEVNRRHSEQTAIQVEQLNIQKAQAAEERGEVGLREWMVNHGMLFRHGDPDATDESKNITVRAPRKPIVKLSRDAGRYLCEFIFMSSLVYRHRAAAVAPGSEPIAAAATDAGEKLGKVAFLHVPNGTEPADVARGVLVAESAIRSIVASWEDGWRNPLVYAASSGTSTAPISSDGGGFESQSTGDQ